jgi:methylglutaconyl-CoA hydratase
MQEPLDICVDASGVARLTVNRPKKGNSVDLELAEALAAAFETFAADSSLRAVVVTGSGRTFSGGVDLGWMRGAGGASDKANYDDALKLAKLLHRLNTLPVPTIAAVPGRAIGLGVGLVAACDIAVAVDSASFRFSEVRFGILPALISPYVVPALGLRVCQRYMLTAEPFGVTEAMRFGLVHQMCGFDELPHVTQQIVTELLAGKRGAQAAVKSLLQDSRAPKLTDAVIKDTARRLAELRRSPEAQTALSEFLDHKS